jgi:hypothetical protein
MAAFLNICCLGSLASSICAGPFQHRWNESFWCMGAAILIAIFASVEDLKS